MGAVIRALEQFFAGVPLPLLEVWGRFGCLLGLLLMVCAFGGFTLRPGGRWGLGRERLSWDAQALRSSALTFVLILATGWLGSHIVLVPGAQTFESLKDLSVFLCVVLFGYPALLAVPFAYGMSDLIEGVPPDFLLDWLPGYFINPACFWMAYQLIGKNPDFRRAPTWGSYLLFVALFMAIEPVLWGYICAGKFTPVISYRSITPALFFTTSITWLIGPFAMLAALPLARRLRMFWAEIPGHVRERRLGSNEWLWQSGGASPAPIDQGLPIRLALALPLIGLVLLMVGSTAYQTLSSAEASAGKLAGRLHEEIAENISLHLDDYLAGAGDMDETARRQAIGGLLHSLPIAATGRAFVVTRAGKPIASSLPTDLQGDGAESDPVLQLAMQHVAQRAGGAQRLRRNTQFQFDVVTAKPLSRETWLAQVTPYLDRAGKRDWLLLTVMPAGYYLEGVRAGNSQSAMVSAVALLASLLIAAQLASVVAVPLRRLSQASVAMSRGDLQQRVAGSGLQELDALSRSFNEMAQQLGRRTERLELATRAGQMGVWDWDVVGGRVEWDEAMYAVHGVTTGRFDNRFESWAALLHPDDLQRTKDDVAAALAGVRDYDTDYRILLSDGRLRRIAAVAQVVREATGKPLRMVGINYDITERKNAEDELRRHRDQLETLVGARTAALSVAVAQAEAATLAKSEFLANMSHEIRTPMNAIFGMTELALRTELTPRQRDYLDKTRTAAEALLGLINDVLDFSKIEAGKMEIAEQAFELRELLDGVSALVGHGAQRKGLVFRLELAADVPQRLLGDPQRLAQVLTNLCNNAVKFTEQGEIVVTVSREDGPPGAAATVAAGAEVRLLFSVRDTGIGINEAQQQRLFKPFSQADASITRQYGGTGLGLAISRQLVELMGGRIGLQSEAGRGSEFHFSVRLRLAAPAPSSSPRVRNNWPVPPPHVQGRQILLVEDNELNQLVASELLIQVLGVQVQVASNGQKGLELLAGQRFDAVLTDLQMPVMDGYVFARTIRQDPALAGLPIIAMTAHAAAQERDRCMAAGMNDFISKPFRPEQLFDVLSRCLAPAVPPLDPPASLVRFAEGLDRFMGREPLYRQLLTVYLDKHADDGRRMQAAQAAQGAGERAAIDALLHDIIASAGAIGADSLVELARQLRSRVGSEAVPAAELRGQVDAFAALHGAVLGEVRGHLAARPVAAGSA